MLLKKLSFCCYALLATTALSGCSLASKDKTLSKQEITKRKISYQTYRSTNSIQKSSTASFKHKSNKFDGKIINANLAREIFGKRPKSWANCSYFSNGNQRSLSPLKGTSLEDRKACIAFSDWNSRNQTLTEYFISDNKCSDQRKKVCMGGYKVLSTIVTKLDAPGSSIYNLNTSSKIFIPVTDKTSQRTQVQTLNRRIYASLDSEGNNVIYLDLRTPSGELVYTIVKPLPLIPRLATFISCSDLALMVESTIQGMTIGTGVGITIGLTVGLGFVGAEGGPAGVIMGAATGLGAGLALTDVVIFPVGFFLAEQTGKTIRDLCNRLTPPSPPTQPPGLKPEDIINELYDDGHSCPPNLIPNICVRELPDSHSIEDDGTIVIQDGGYETFLCCTVPSADQ